MSKNILKLFGLLALIVVVIVGSVYLITRRTKIVYEYDQIKTGKITEAVNVSGTIKAAENIDLAFERSGKISKKYVTVGDTVVVGQPLLALDNSAAAAQLAQAQAALDKQLAGNRPEYIAQLAATVKQAQANYDQVVAASNNSLHAATALELTAENNLKLAAGGETSQIVEDAYENMAALLQATQNTLASSLTKADNILGVDDMFANDRFENVLAAKDLTKYSLAKDAYAQAKTAQQALASANSLASPTNHSQVDAAVVAADSALSTTRDLLQDVSAVLDNTITSSNLSFTDLDTLKTIIQGARTDVAAKITALTDQKHALALAKNSYTTYQIAYDKANQDLSDLKNKIAADTAAAQAAVDRAQAVLDDAQNPPRAVDVASFRAAVAAAQVEYNKTILVAPIAGTISRQDGELGTLAAPNVPLVSIISNNKYQIEVYLAETDLPKVKVGSSASVTLDNLGNTPEFPAQVIKIDPAATTAANGTSAYKTTLEFTNEDERLQVGLSANIKIIGATSDNVLIIPARDVVQKDGQYFAMVLNSQQVLEQRPIEIGLKGEGDQWEVTSGLQAGDSVVSFSSANN